MPNLPDDASLPDDIPTLEAQIGEIEQAKADCEAALRRLTEAEDHAKGVFFAQEIHEARQLRLQLEVQKELRRVRTNRIRPNVPPF